MTENTGAQNINVTVQMTKAKKPRRFGFWGWFGLLLVLGTATEHWYYAVITAAVFAFAGYAWYLQKQGRL